MQFGNAAHNDNQIDRFVGRNEFHHDGARLADAMMWANRGGGGSLMWAHDAQSPACYGSGSASQWRWGGVIDYSNYEATSNGGPYVALNGIDELLTIADAPWQESTTNNFLVWAWFYIDTTDIIHNIAAKWTAAGNLRSWYLLVGSSERVRLAASADGIASTTIDSSVTLSVDQFYFAAGYFVPSTLMRVFVGSADDTTLTVTSLTTSVPASLADRGAPLTIGSISGGSYLSGRIGVGLARANVPSANIQSHLTRIFASTRWFYQE